MVAGVGKKDANYILWIDIGRSASSRLGKVMEIGDLNCDESIDYLCNKRAIAKSVAQDIYSLVGGRIGLLARAAYEMDSGLDFPGLSPTRYLQQGQVIPN